MDTISENPDKPWDFFCGVSYNTNVTIEFIEEHSHHEWDWEFISKSVHLTVDIIQKYSNKFNWVNLSSNPHLTVEIIESTIDKHWQWQYISRNKFMC